MRLSFMTLYLLSDLGDAAAYCTAQAVIPGEFLFYRKGRFELRCTP